MNALMYLQSLGIQRETMERLEGVFELFDESDDIPSWLSEIRIVGTNSTRKFGSANHDKMIIRMSNLVMSMGQRRDTFLHELAHIVSIKVFGEAGRGHGDLWQMVAKELGSNGQRCGRDEQFRASVEQRREALEKTVAKCTRCGFEFKRMRRSKRDWSRFIHGGGCGGQLVNFRDEGRV